VQPAGPKNRWRCLLRYETAVSTWTATTPPALVVRGHDREPSLKARRNRGVEAKNLAVTVDHVTAVFDGRRVGRLRWLSVGCVSLEEAQGRRLDENPVSRHHDLRCPPSGFACDVNEA